jgi:nucleotide-binding universal stress UspA family protein
MISAFVPYDFSTLSDVAARQACMLKMGQPVRLTLLHVCSEDDRNEQTVELDSIANKLSAEFGIEVLSQVVIGDVLPSIDLISSGSDFQLMPVGTHGVKGIRQFLFGSDILRLVRHAHCASLVVQETSRPKASLKKVLLPAGAHISYIRLAESLISLLKANESEVLVYTIRRPMEELSEALVQNRAKAVELFTGAGIPCRIVEEESNVVSFGFAKQTLSYATANAVDLIGIVPQASDEFTYMADAEKERFLINDAGIPVWCFG